MTPDLLNLFLRDLAVVLVDLSPPEGWRTDGQDGHPSDVIPFAASSAATVAIIDALAVLGIEVDAVGADVLPRATGHEEGGAIASVPSEGRGPRLNFTWQGQSFDCFGAHPEARAHAHRPEDRLAYQPLLPGAPTEQALAPWRGAEPRTVDAEVAYAWLLERMRVHAGPTAVPVHAVSGT